MANITSSITPSISLSLGLNVSVGRNQIQRNAGNYSAIYLADTMQVNDSVIELTGSDTIYSNVNDYVKTLVVSTTSPLKLEMTKLDDTVISINVNRMIIIDDAIKKYTLTNLSATVVARVALNSVTYKPPAP